MLCLLIIERVSRFSPEEKLASVLPGNGTTGENFFINEE